MSNISIISVDFQKDFSDEKGKHYKQRKNVDFIKNTLVPYFRHGGIKVAEIISDYRLPRPADPDDSCRAGEWGYESEIPEDIKLKPVWAMSYQGKHNEDFSSDFFQNEAFPFLKRALMNMDDSMPFRGPKEFVDGDFRYAFELKGDYQYFTGRESITHKGIEVFFQDVMGELIK